MSQIIINDIPPYTQAIAILGQTVFGTNWTANFASDVVVYLTPFGDAADDLTQILSYPSQYSVDFIGDQLQVQVTLVTSTAAGDRVTITRMTPADRENLYTNTNFLPSMLNNDFGILTLVDQQAQLVNQAIAPRYNYSAIINADSSFPTADTIIPILGPNQTWVMNGSRTQIEAVTVSSASGTVSEIDTGLGLTGGPITSTGTISFGSMAANSFWGNITGSTALPTEVPTTYFLKSANNLSDLTNVPQARINLGLQIGVNVEAWSPALDSIAALVTSANQIPYLIGSNSYSVMAAAANSVLVTDAGSVPSLGTTLPTAVQINITQLGAQVAALNMNTHQIHNVVDPSAAQDAATKAYVDSQSGAFLPLTGGTMSGAINMGNNKIDGMADPTLSQDAVTLSYLNTQLALKLSLSGGTMSGAINMGSNFITNLLDPVNPQDAATKNYVDLVATGLTVQPACYAATTANLNAIYVNGASGIGATLTNAGALTAFTTDGTSPPTNARILVWNQTSTFQNGIYTLTNQGSGAVAWILTRATDYDQPAEIQPGDLVIINNGTVYAGTSFIETASVSAIGTDPILFSQFTFSATAVLLKANNLSDVANTTTSFNNISPLTTKGDLIGFSTQNVRLAVGASDGQILQVSSGAATGIAWSTATYPVTTTVNQILYSNASNKVVGLSTTIGGVLVTDAGGVPQFLSNPSATGKVLQSVNGAISAWSTPTYPTGSGAAGKIFISDGTNNVYSTPTFPNTSPGAGKIFIGDGTNWLISTPAFPTASPGAGKIMFGDGTNWILSTPTFPNVSATARKIIISDGTNWVPSTETYATPGTSGHVLTSDGTNWTSAAPVGTGTVNAGLINQVAYYAAAGTAVSGAALSQGLSIVGTTLTVGISNNIEFNDTQGIIDSNNNNFLLFTKVASAVNYLQISNAATAGLPGILATGSDAIVNLNISVKGNGLIALGNNGGANNIALFGSTAGTIVNYLSFTATTTGVAPAAGVVGTDSNILFQLVGKGTSGVGIQGTSTNDNAVTGNVGEYVTSLIASGSAVSLANATPKTITSISLTAGDWDVWGEFDILGGASTTVTIMSAGISATNNTLATIPSDAGSYTKVLTTSGTSWTVGGTGVPALALTPCRVSISGTTTYYLVASCNFGTSTLSGYGKICARRRR